jgi:hypothetical protein
MKGPIEARAALRELRRRCGGMTGVRLVVSGRGAGRREVDLNEADRLNSVLTGKAIGATVGALLCAILALVATKFGLPVTFVGYFALLGLLLGSLMGRLYATATGADDPSQPLGTVFTVVADEAHIGKAERLLRRYADRIDRFETVDEVNSTALHLR